MIYVGRRTNLRCNRSVVSFVSTLFYPRHSYIGRPLVAPRFPTAVSPSRTTLLCIPIMETLALAFSANMRSPRRTPALDIHPGCRGVREEIICLQPAPNPTSRTHVWRLDGSDRTAGTSENRGCCDGDHGFSPVCFVRPFVFSTLANQYVALPCSRSLSRVSRPDCVRQFSISFTHSPGSHPHRMQIFTVCTGQVSLFIHHYHSGGNICEKCCCCCCCTGCSLMSRLAMHQHTTHSHSRARTLSLSLV